MKDNNYWIDFWNKNNIINKNNVHEKVGRTIKGVPIKEEQWKDVINDLENQLELNKNDDVLDIAAGSGALSIPFSKIVNSVIAVDISEKLINDLNGIENIKTILADARSIEFNEAQFSKIILYFALQHFSEKETMLLFKKIYKWLKPGGFFYIGDIPDSDKKFEFFNNRERESAYFNSILTDEPIIGTWFNKEFLEKLGIFIGFKQATLIEQPEEYINAHYRFDILLRK